MSDVCDDSDKKIEDAVIDGVEWASIAVARMDPGVEGDCSYCGESMPRLVRGACAPCRDKYKLG